MSYLKTIEQDIIKAINNIGYEVDKIDLTVSNRPDLGDYQINDAMKLAKAYHKNPREIANEISLMDVNDKSGQNGTLDRSGHDRLYTKSPEILKKELKINYDTMNLKNLGEPGDIK